jgi:hypothetical protein
MLRGRSSSRDVDVHTAFFAFLGDVHEPYGCERGKRHVRAGSSLSRNGPFPLFDVFDTG